MCSPRLASKRIIDLCPLSGELLNHDALNFVEIAEVGAAIVKVRRPGVGVIGHLLRHFPAAAAAQILSEAGCAERAADAVGADRQAAPGGNPPLA